MGKIFVYMRNKTREVIVSMPDKNIETQNVYCRFGYLDVKRFIKKASFADSFRYVMTKSFILPKNFKCKIKSIHHGRIRNLKQINEAPALLAFIRTVVFCDLGNLQRLSLSFHNNNRITTSSNISNSLK